MEVEASSPLQAPTFRHPFRNQANYTMDSPSRSKNYLGIERMTSPIERMTSPTTNLAADLSENFHIDQTLALPTPRRSLFSSLKGRSWVTTPPIPSSSPGSDMDMSPLPHKAPFGNQQPPRSPTDLGMDINSFCSSPPTASPCVDRPVNRPKIAERRISRPSLLRGGSRLSGNSVSFKSQAPNPVAFSRAPQMKLEELFGGASPEQKKSGGFLTASKPFSMADGSPVAPVARRASIQRPKGKVRRTMSMFENAEDVLQSEATEEEAKLNPGLSAAPMAEPEQKAILPSFTVKDDPLRRINRATLIDVMDGQYKEHFDEHVIVDCRFEYEYEGGHISGAININSIDVLEETFFNEKQDKRRLIIFHCEYSAHRAPRMALHLRKRDRTLNMHRYPELNYPEIYILEGGYSSFFNQHKMRCEPQDYVEMDDEKHKRTCEREMSKFRRLHKFGRTNTFTYGAAHDLDSSPSAGIASKRIDGKNRRMATY